MCSDPDVCPAGYHLQNTCPKSGDKGKLVKASEPTPKPKKAKPAKKAAKKADAKKAPAKKAAAPKAKPKAPSQMSEAEIYDEMARLARRKAKLRAAKRKMQEEEEEEESESESESEEE
jgi:hypothetical protein